MVALWAFHLYQRRFKDAGTRKRIATLSLTMVIIGGVDRRVAVLRYGIGDTGSSLLPPLAVAVVIWQRRLMLPYRGPASGAASPCHSRGCFPGIQTPARPASLPQRKERH